MTVRALFEPSPNTAQATCGGYGPWQQQPQGGCVYLVDKELQDPWELSWLSWAVYLPSGVLLTNLFPSTFYKKFFKK